LRTVGKKKYSRQRNVETGEFKGGGLSRIEKRSTLEEGKKTQP